FFLFSVFFFFFFFFFFFQAEDGIRDKLVTGVQTCALPISLAGPDVCHSGPASAGVGVCGHHGVRIELHAFHSDHIFWGGALDTKSIAASEDQAKSSVGVDATLPPAQAGKLFELPPPAIWFAAPSRNASA